MNAPSGRVTSKSVTVSFFRVEGILSSRPSLAAPAWLAANAQTFRQRAFGLGTVLAAAPLALSKQDPGTAHRLAWAGLRDVSEDRLILLGETYFEGWLQDNVPEAGTRVLAQARKRGDKVVLVSDNVDVVVSHLANQLGVDDLVCNHLEIRNGRATGRLTDPVVAGHVGGSWLKSYAEQHGINLEKSTAYGHSELDASLLSSVGMPCAVNPQAGLRRMARDLDWPILVD